MLPSARSLMKQAREPQWKKQRLISRKVSNYSWNARMLRRSTGECTRKCLYRDAKRPVGNLRVLSGREVCQILPQRGVVEVRRRGSHIGRQHRTATGTVTVPALDHHEHRLGILQSVFRQSSVARREFESEG